VIHENCAIESQFTAFNSGLNLVATVELQLSNDGYLGCQSSVSACPFG